MKTILITGATSGIGLALAKLCSTKGYQVIACGRNQQALTELSKLDNVTTLSFDVTDEDASRSALAGIKPDIAVLNAGVCEYVDINQLEPAMFQRVFSANFFGVVNCVAALTAQMKQGSQLVLVDSLARLLPFTRSQAYGASKAALHYFCKSLEVDLDQKGIIVQSVSPGFVATPLTDKNDFEMPMRISVEKAVESMLCGIENGSKSIYFPKLFSAFLRICSHLPNRVKVAMSKRINNQQSGKAK
jgi:NAD(P)-dependent dehydrogenase (short-subunit alcohol dehydrogenase family)